MKEIKSPKISELLVEIKPLIAKQQKAYYEKNKDRIAKQKKAYRERNKEFRKLPISERRRLIYIKHLKNKENKLLKKV